MCGLCERECVVGVCGCVCEGVWERERVWWCVRESVYVWVVCGWCVWGCVCGGCVSVGVWWVCVCESVCVCVCV